MKKLIIVLSILLIAQVILSVVLLWPKSAATPVSGPLWADFKADEVISLTASDKDGNTMTVTRKDDGWVLSSVDDYPVQADKITPVLEKLGELKTNRLVTRTEGSHRRLQVATDEFNRLVDVEMKDGTHHKLYLGSSAAAGATHFRAADHAEVYLTADLTPWEAGTQAGSWVDTLYLTVPQTTTVALKLENANGAFDFKRESEKWTLDGLAEGEAFNESAFTSMLSQATSLRMIEPLGKEAKPEYGLDEPSATLTLTTEQDGASKTYTVKFGPKAEDKYVAQSSESPYYAQIGAYVGDTFANKKREDFISPPATPTTSVEAGLFSAADLMEATAEPTAEPPAPEPSPQVEATEEVTATLPTVEATEAVTTTASATVAP